MDITFILSIVLWPLCIFIIGLILLQGGAGDLSSAFGGGGQLDSTLGVGAGRKMSKLTGWLGVTFLVIVTILAIPSKSSFRAIAGPGDPNAPKATTQPQPGGAPVIISQPGDPEHQVTITPLRKGTGAPPPVDATAPATPPADQAPAPEAAPADAAPAAPAPETKPAEEPKAEMSAPQPKSGKKLTLEK